MASSDDPASHSSQRSYTPDLVRRALSARPGDALPIANSAPAAVLFADISGFTPVTEQYTARGPAGIEELSELLEHWFGGLVDLIAAHGGDVVKFAGDAVLAAWFTLPGEAAADACARAAACGLAVGRGPGRLRTVDGVTLDLTLAVGAGDLCWMQLGGVADQRQLFVTGPPVRQVAAAQLAARPGELVLSPEAWALVSERAEGHLLPDGCVRLHALSAPSPRSLPDDASDVDTTPALRAFVPAAVRARLDAGQAEWLAELRRVSVVFVVLSDLDERTAPEQAQAAVAALLALCETYEATLNGLAVDEKGACAKVVFGLPPRAHEDDPKRAIELARALSATLTGQGRRHSLGVTRGRVYCGTVGSATRREYMMVGDTVNLAARLAVASATHPALGSLPVLCDEATARAVAGRGLGLGLRPLEPIPLKGKAQRTPVHALDPLAGTGAPPPTLPLVGRRTERAVLERALGALQHGQSGRYLVQGEAGIGKTSLLTHVHARAATRGLPVLRAEAHPTGRARSYGAWRPAIEGLLDALGPEAAGGGPDLIAALAARDRELSDLAPLLQAFLPLGLVDNDHTAGLTGELRADRVRRLVGALLRVVLGDGPLVLLVEDAQWVDSASWGVLSWLWSTRDATLVVVSARPVPSPPAALRALRADPRCETLTLAPLSQAESLELGALCIGIRSLPPALARLVAERAEGHPFFSVELVRAARDAGLIRIAGGRGELMVPPDELDRLSLPDTLQGAITARIDQLEPQPQLTAKVASVIGRRFAASVLAHVHPLESDRPRLDEGLATLADRNLTRLVQRTPDEIHAFEHTLTRTVAYELMSFAQRRLLHRAVAVHLEHTTPEPRPHLVPALAHHWLHALDERQPDAEDGTRALDYLVRAGEQAIREFANEEAVGLLEDALALNARLGSPMPPRRQADLECWLGQACLHLGRMPASGAHAERAIAILDRPVPGARGRWTRLVVEAWTQLRFQLGLLRAPSQPDPDALQASRAYATLFVVRYQANQSLPTVHAAMRGVALALRGGGLAEQADGLATLGLIAGTAPLHGLARRYGRQALTLAEQSDHPVALSWVLEVIGVYAIGAGRWDDVERWVGRAADIAERIGHGRRWEETHALLAWLSYFRGHPGQAAERWAAVAVAAEQRRDPQPRIWGLCGMVEAGWIAGTSDVDACRQMLYEARAQLPHDIYRAEAIRTLGGSALMAARAGALDDAREAATHALQAIRGLAPTTFYSVEGYAGTLEALIGLEVNAPHDATLRRARREAEDAMARFARVFPIAGPRFALHAGLLRWGRGHPRSARRHWRRGLRQARALGMPLEELRLLDVLAIHGLPAGSPRTPSAAQGVAHDRLRPWWLAWPQ